MKVVVVVGHVVEILCRLRFCNRSESVEFPIGCRYILLRENDGLMLQLCSS